MKRLLFLLSVFFLTSCGLFVKKTKVYYNTTSCADPWRNYEQFSEKRRVKKYLRENNVRVYNINKFYNEMFVEVCEACTCTGGDVLEVVIAEEDKDIALSLVFYE